jgi:ACS family glucarate transporter-like MFS transporter
MKVLERAGRLPMKYRNRVLSFLFFLSLITFIDRAGISVAGPQMQTDLGLPPERWGWILGASYLAYAAFEIRSGMLGDRLGARRVLTRIVLWWSAFTTLTRASGNLVTLGGIRFGSGLARPALFRTHPPVFSDGFRWESGEGPRA